VSVWRYPQNQRQLSHRLRSSEAQRQRHGHLPALELVHMQAIPGIRFRTCQWIVETSRPPIFCAAPVAVSGCAWCADHAAIVFAPKQEPENG